MIDIISINRKTLCIYKTTTYSSPSSGDFLIMVQTFYLTIVALLIQQYAQVIEAVTCARNPCNLVAGLYEPATGYCCYDLAPNYVDALCTCPNNIPSLVNAPCRAVTTNPAACTRVCVNGGVCNIVNGQPVCWCASGFSGSNCEIQGIANRCYPGLCQVGTCLEQQIGVTLYAYCQCAPGYRGITCNQCYFTCPRAGVFPDTAQCAIGKYFYCAQAGSVPTAALCPTGQRFNRLTNQCDVRYQCT